MSASITLAHAALDYAARGIGVFPLVPKAKTPMVASGFKEASHDHGQVAAWWRRWPQANVGIATGASGGFWVLDVDGEAAEADLAALIAVHGPLPATVEQATGNGRHLCFTWDPGQQIRNSQSRIGRGIDVRGEGGYIVAPPSIHPGDPKKGVPPGRIYAWSPGRSPGEMAFARAPAWLIGLAMPAPEAPAAPASATSSRREVEHGRASRFGEATLSTVCRLIATSPPGKQQGALWGYACQIGAYVAGREIEHAYARRALIDAGLRMVPAGKPWLQKDVESHVDRGLAKGALHPKTAPEQRAFEPAQRRAPTSSAPSPAQVAVDIGSARALWDSARPADCGLVRTWLRSRGLDPQGLPGALGRMRALQRAPIGGPEARNLTGPALLVSLTRDPDDHEWNAPIDALAVLPLDGRAERFCGFIGPAAGRVALLTPWPEDGALLVAIDLQDAWALGQNAHESGHQLGVVVAPSLRTFAGGALGDRYRRMDPRTPYADPDDPPWTAAGERTVFLAVRDDLRTPEIRSRKTFGGTQRATLTGEAAARFYGGLAEQAWRRAGANQVRILRPPQGSPGFNSERMGRGA